MPMRSRILLMLISGDVMSVPSKRICPEVGRSSKLRLRRKVDLPHPEGDDGDDLAFAYGGADVAQHYMVAEGLAEMVDGDERFIFHFCVVSFPVPPQQRTG